MELQIIETTKGKPSATLLSYQYRQHRINKDNVTTWLCVKEKSQKCRGTLKTINGEFLSVSEHCCKVNFAEVEINIQKATAKKRARESDTDVSKIYREEVEPLFDKGYEFIADVPEFASIKGALYRHRRQAQGLTAEMSWASELVLQLIEEIKIRPIFYSLKNKDYYNKHVRNVALEEIRSKLAIIRPNITTIEIIRKWNGLRNTYATERRKYISSIENGDENIYTPTLWYYQNLSFLQNHVAPKINLSNSDSISNSSHDETSFQNSESVFLQETLPSTSASNIHQLHIKQEVNPDDEITIEYENKIEHNYSNTIDNSSPLLQKRRRVDEQSEPFISDEVNCLNEILTNVKSIRTNLSQIDGDDTLYGRYVTKRLASIKNKRLKLEAKFKIDRIFYEIGLNDLEDV